MQRINFFTLSQIQKKSIQNFISANAILLTIIVKYYIIVHVFKGDKV